MLYQKLSVWPDFGRMLKNGGLGVGKGYLRAGLTAALALTTLGNTAPVYAQNGTADVPPAWVQFVPLVALVLMVAIAWSLWSKSKQNFVQTTLSLGESIKYRAHVSIWSMWPTMLIGIAFFIAGFAYSMPPFFTIVIIVFGAAFLKWRSTELAITDKKVVAKYGLFQRNTVEILIPRIESIQIQQGLIGGMIGYGTVILLGTGNSAIPIVGISDPLGFRQSFVKNQESFSIHSPPKI